MEFLAEITQHIPDPGMQMVRYYGWYSNKMRGQRAKRADSATPDPAASETDDEDTPYRKLARMHWAALIKRVWEVDPLLCPKCGDTMAIVSFIEKRDQADVIEKILKYCKLWERQAARAPPKATGPPVQPVLLRITNCSFFPPPPQPDPGSASHKLGIVASPAGSCS